MGRAPCCQKLGLKQGKWTKEEDGILANYIAQHGEGSWRSLPKNAGLLRCGKSCRLRWLNYLRNGLRRGKFSKEEDDLIAKLHAIHGNRAVSRIMKSLEMDNRRAGHNRRCTGGEKYLPTPYAETTT